MVSLADFSGRFLRLRFVYDCYGGQFHAGIDSGKGWHMDNVEFTNIHEITPMEAQNADAGERLALLTTYLGSCFLKVESQNGANAWLAGPAVEVIAAQPFSHNTWASAFFQVHSVLKQFT